jgi:hypothetical protein
MPKTLKSESANILSFPCNADEADKLASASANVVDLPPNSDVIATIHIELRRGGKIVRRVDGITPSNAHRISSAIVRVLAETIQSIKR